MRNQEVQQEAQAHRVCTKLLEDAPAFDASKSRIPANICNGIQAIDLPDPLSPTTYNQTLLSYISQTTSSLSSNSYVRITFKHPTKDAFYFCDFQTLKEAQDAVRQLPGDIVAITATAENKCEVFEKCNELQILVGDSGNPIFLAKVKTSLDNSLLLLGNKEEYHLMRTVCEQTSSVFSDKFQEFGEAVAKARIQQGMMQSEKAFKAQVVQLYSCFVSNFLNQITRGTYSQYTYKDFNTASSDANQAIKEMLLLIPELIKTRVFDWLERKKLIINLHPTTKNTEIFPTIIRLGNLNAPSTAEFTIDEVSGLQRSQVGEAIKNRFIVITNNTTICLKDAIRLSLMPAMKGSDSDKHPGILNINRESEHFYTYSGTRFNSLLDSSKIASRMFELLQLQSALHSNLPALEVGVDTTLKGEGLGNALKSRYNGFLATVKEKTKQYGVLDIDTIINTAKQKVDALILKGSKFSFANNRADINNLETELIEQIVISVAKSCNILVDFKFNNEQRVPLAYLPTAFAGRTLEQIASWLVSSGATPNHATAFIEENLDLFKYAELDTLLEYACTSGISTAELFVQDFRKQLDEFLRLLNEIGITDELLCMAVTGQKRGKLLGKVTTRQHFNTLENVNEALQVIKGLDSNLTSAGFTEHKKITDIFIAKWKELSDTNGVKFHLDELANEIQIVFQRLNKDVLNPSIQKLQNESARKKRGRDTTSELRGVLEKARKDSKDASGKLVTSSLVEQLFFNSREELVKFRAVFNDSIDLPTLYKLIQDTYLNIDNFIHGYQSLKAHGAELSPQSYLKLLGQFSKYNNFIGISAGDQERDRVIMTRLFTLLAIQKNGDTPEHTRIIFNPEDTEKINDAIARIDIESGWNNIHVNTLPKEL